MPLFELRYQLRVGLLAKNVSAHMQRTIEWIKLLYE